MKNYSNFTKAYLKCGAKMAKYEEWITEEGLLKIEGWARDGLTDRQIAHNIGITEQTLNIWKKSHPSVFESLKKGKEVIDRQVENALLKKALGYDYEEVREEYEYGQLAKRTVTKKHIPGDTTAQIFWLKNRKPGEWREKKEVEVSGEINNPYAGLTTEELKRLIRDG